MALRSDALTTVARAKTFAGIGSLTSAQDVILESIVNAVTVYIQRKTGRIFKRATYTSELLNSNGGNVLVVKNYPITPSTTLTLEYSDGNGTNPSWSEVSTANYQIDLNSGLLYAVGGGSWGRGAGRYRVTYTGGFNYDNSSTYLSDTDAADIEYAAWKMITAAWSSRADNGNVESERIGDYAVTFARTAFEDPEVKSILDAWKVSEIHTYITPKNYGNY